jgi:hypothetical protein
MWLMHRAYVAHTDWSLGAPMETLQGTAANRAKLDQWMNERRKELRLRWAKVAELAGMVTSNLLRIRKGEIGISWDAADGIEHALQWERGSVQAAVLKGTRPTPRGGDGPARAESPSAASSVVWTREMDAFYYILKAKFDADGLEMNEANVLSAIDQLRIELVQRVSRQDPIPNDSR